MIYRFFPEPSNVTRLKFNPSTNHIQFLDFENSFPTGRIREFRLNSSNSLFLKYLALTMSCNIPCWVSNFHHHLTIRLVFSFLKSLTPRPPCFGYTNPGPFDQVIPVFLVTPLLEKSPSVFVKLLSGKFYSLTTWTYGKGRCGRVLH